MSVHTATATPCVGCAVVVVVWRGAGRCSPAACMQLPHRAKGMVVISACCVCVLYGAADYLLLCWTPERAPAKLDCR